MRASFGMARVMPFPIVFGASVSRSSNLKRHMVLSVLIKGGGFLVSLVLMRVYIGFFTSSTVLGLWFTLLAVLNWIMTFDFGVGNGLRNRLVEALAEDNRTEQKALVSTTYALSASIAGAALTAGAAAVVLLDWNSLLNVSSALVTPSSLQWAVFVVIVAVCVQLVLKNVNSVLYAMQLPSASNATGLATNLMLLGSMALVTTSSDQTGILVLASLYLVCSTLPLAVLTLWLFAGRMRHAFPDVRRASGDAAAKVLGLGMGFFALQLMSLVIFRSSELVITRTISPSDVVEYQLYNRLYGALASLVWIALVPMWSAVSEAYFMGDHEWIDRVFRKLRSHVPGLVLVLVGLTVSLQPIFNVWLGVHSIEVNYWYGGAFAVYYSLYVWWAVLASFANGTGRIRTQLVCAGFGVCVYLLVAIMGATLTGRWIAVVWAGIAGMITYAVLEPRNIRRLTEGMKNG